jgi:hypothetical protein
VVLLLHSLCNNGQPNLVLQFVISDSYMFRGAEARILKYIFFSKKILILISYTFILKVQLQITLWLSIIDSEYI